MKADGRWKREIHLTRMIVVVHFRLHYRQRWSPGCYQRHHGGCGDITGVAIPRGSISIRAASFVSSEFRTSVLEPNLKEESQFYELKSLICPPKSIYLNSSLTQSHFIGQFLPNKGIWVVSPANYCAKFIKDKD